MFQDVILEDYASLKEFANKLKNVEKIELLPYKTIGVIKYEKLNLPYPLKDVEEMDEEKCKRLEKLLCK